MTIQNYLEGLVSNSRTILVLGDFDILHPGHIRLLKFAKECGDVLIVGINDRKVSNAEHRVSGAHRLEVIQSLDCVDYAFVNKKAVTDVISELKPWAVVKGHEFEKQYNEEIEAVERYGGRLIFGSGESLSTTSSFFIEPEKQEHNFEFDPLKPYASRHNITLDKVKAAMQKVSSLKVAVIGEVIVDEYIQGTAVGMSQEDPTIVMTPTEKSLFLGGAAITAAHVKALGADEVELISVVGEDEISEFVIDKCNEYDVNISLNKDYSRPTPLKTRYRVGNKTLLRVNHLRQHKISANIQNKVFRKLSKRVSELDLVIFSDFNYGLLPQELVERITHWCQKNNILVVADSQTSSQLGDISRYQDMTLITPTEREVRVALGNQDDGLVILANKLNQKSNAKHIAITLGSEGVFLHLPIPEQNTWENDQLPAININAIDPAGGGDCFLAAASLLLTTGADSWLAYYVASIASAYQVDRVGNRPISLMKLNSYIERSFE